MAITQDLRSFRFQTDIDRRARVSSTDEMQATINAVQEYDRPPVQLGILIWVQRYPSAYVLVRVYTG